MKNLMRSASRFTIGNNELCCDGRWCYACGVANELVTGMFCKPFWGKPVLRSICILVLGATLSIFAQAYAAVGPVFSIEVEAQAQSDLSGALTRIDTEVAQALGQSEPDIHLVYSLIRLKADTLIGAKQFEAAASILSELAIYSQTNRLVLSLDPVGILREAAMLYERAGALRAGLEGYKQVLAQQSLDNALVSERRKTLTNLARLARLRGRENDAQPYLAAADNLASNTDENGLLGASNGARGEAENGSKRMVVYYATDRARSGDSSPNRFYSSGRGTLEYGTAIVTIPNSHKAGAMEAPTIWSLEFSESPSKHIVLKSVTPQDKATYFRRMRTHLEKKGADDAFVFIHGFNVSFESAAKRTAQLAHDMSFSGLPIVYSWPSKASLLSYVADTAVVRLSGRRLSGFLEDLTKRSGARRIHIIAHSMGNRALTDALELMALRVKPVAGKPPLFDQIIFAAPDVDAGLFTSMIRTIRPLARRLTLYASQQDWALKASRRLHGDSPRAGQGGESLVASPILDSVDMSALGEDMLAHSYFAADSSALVDVVSLFWRNVGPSQRCGLEKGSQKPGRQGWTYQPNQCEYDIMLSLLSHLREEKVNDVVEAKNLLLRLVSREDLRAKLLPVIENLFRQ